MSVNPGNDRKYPPSLIAKAMKEEIHYSLQPKKNAKVQALDVIKQLKAKSFPIDRCKSQVKVNIPIEFKDTISKIKKMAREVMNESDANEIKELNMTIVPNQLKQIQDILSKETGGKGTVELVSLNKQNASDQVFT